MIDLRERWRKAAVDPEPYAGAAGDAAVRVVLEALSDRASYGLNLDDGIWCRRLLVLLDDGQLAGFAEEDE